MMKVTTVKAAALTTILLLAALVSILFIFVIGGGDGDRKLGSIPLPGIKLASAAQAEALALVVPVLNIETVGILTHLDLDIDGANPFSLQPGSGDSAGFLNTVREHLVGTTGIGSIEELQDNFLRARWCVPHREGCTNIRLFVDSSGKIVSFLTRGEPTGRIAQFGGLDAISPSLRDDNFDNVLVGGVTTKGGIKELIGLFGNEIPNGLDTVPSGGGQNLQQQIIWFNFGQPEADRLLMISKARGEAGTSTVNIALPPPVQANVKEVSFAHDSPHVTACCPRTKLFLNGSEISNQLFDRIDFTTGFFNLSSFKATPAHEMRLKLDTTSASTAAALAILYESP